MQRPARLALLLPASSASLPLPGIIQVNEYQFTANTITIAINYILFGRSYSDYTTTQPQTV
jgi:hypothetical protein